MSYYGPSSPDPRQPNPYQSGSYGWNPQGGAPQPPQNYHTGFMPVAQPGTLPLRPLSLAGSVNSRFTTVRTSPGLFFGAALVFRGLPAILTCIGAFVVSRSMGNLGTIDPYAELGHAMDGVPIWILVSMLLA